MLKKLIYAVVLIMAMATEIPAGVIDASTRALMHDTAVGLRQRRPASGAAAPTHLPMIVQIADDEALEALRDLGAEIWRHRDDLVLCNIPIESLPGVDLTEGLVCASTGLVEVAMDHARQDVGFEALHTALPPQTWYDGSGVVAGMCDIGFDATHLNFRHPGGQSRVGRYIIYDEPYNRRTDLTSGAEILDTGAECADNYHATHVGGILAGSYSANNYQGMAPGAEMAVMVSRLYSPTLLAGMEDIIEYAKSVGKPAVINLSIADMQGPHDGTTLFNQYLAKLGREAIICIAAGNSGTTPRSIHRTFGPSLTSVGTLPSSYNRTFFDGSVDVWSGDARPFNVKIVVYDRELQTLVSETDPVGPATPYADILMSADVRPYADKGFEYLRRVDAFRRYGIEGYVAVSSEINPHNGRAHALVRFVCGNVVMSSGGQDRYRVGLMVTPADNENAEGQRIDMLAEGFDLAWAAADGFLSGRPDMCINDLACGDNLICVGMLNNRTSVPLYNGDTQSENTPEGVVSPHSSFATLIDGRTLPHVTAPGNLIVSSFNREWVEAKEERAARVVDIVEDATGQRHYWGAVGGTSMATPLVAGLIATWLEARPDLSVAEARNALRQTVRTLPDPDEPRYGGVGPIDACAATLRVLGITDAAIGEVATEGVRVIPTGQGCLRVEGYKGTLTIFNLQGVCVVRVESPGYTDIDTTTLPAGVYLLRAGQDVYKVLL